MNETFLSQATRVAMALQPGVTEFVTRPLVPTDMIKRGQFARFAGATTAYFVHIVDVEADMHFIGDLTKISQNEHVPDVQFTSDLHTQNLHIEHFRHPVRVAPLLQPHERIMFEFLHDNGSFSPGTPIESFAVISPIPSEQTGANPLQEPAQLFHVQ